MLGTGQPSPMSGSRSTTVRDSFAGADVPADHFQTGMWPKREVASSIVPFSKALWPKGPSRRKPWGKQSFVFMKCFTTFLEFSTVFASTIVTGHGIYR